MPDEKQTTKLTSRYSIGEIVWFQPNFEGIEWDEENRPKPKEGSIPVKAKIAGISFDKAKVMYDLAVVDKMNESGFYEAMPLRRVDSVMVLDFD